jgi:hypothetical protein
MNFLFIPLLLIFQSSIYASVNTEPSFERLVEPMEERIENGDEPNRHFLKVTKWTISYLVGQILSNDNIATLTVEEDTETLSFLLNQFKRYTKASIITGQIFANKRFLGYRARIEEIREELEKVYLM